MNNILKAIEFARRAHEGQKRKYTGEDYIWHPIEVATIVSTVEHNEDMLVAAILHDVVEDTEVEAWEIYKHFGQNVQNLVLDLTDVSKASDGNRKVRKEIDRQHTASACVEAKTIKLADLISNSKSILQHDEDFAKVYLKEKKMLLDVLTEGNTTLWLQANEIVTKGLKELEEDK